MVHDVKLYVKYFDDVLYGIKEFEIRKNDRGYHVGDTLVLREYDGMEYTGRHIVRKIKYMHIGTGEYGLSDGYCVLGLQDIALCSKIEKRPNNIHKCLSCGYETGKQAAEFNFCPMCGKKFDK